MLDTKEEVLSSAADEPFLMSPVMVELTQFATNTFSAAMASSPKSIDVLYLSYCTVRSVD
jgi:hypothetical protein